VGKGKTTPQSMDSSWTESENLSSSQEYGALLPVVFVLGGTGEKLLDSPCNVLSVGTDIFLSRE